MIRIWAQIVKNEKIKKSIIYENNTLFNINNFHDYIVDICAMLNIATPIILSKHISHFVEFNNSVFKSEDFVEQIDFDKLVLEQANLD